MILTHAASLASGTLPPLAIATKVRTAPPACSLLKLYTPSQRHSSLSDLSCVKLQLSHQTLPTPAEPHPTMTRQNFCSSHPFVHHMDLLVHLLMRQYCDHFGTFLPSGLSQLHDKVLRCWVEIILPGQHFSNKAHMLKAPNVILSNKLAQIPCSQLPAQTA